MAERKPTSAQRGYGGKWQRARAGFLRAHPLCAECMKRSKVVRATTVDHIVPHRGDAVLFWNTSNWQSLCTNCHSSHKQRLEKSGLQVGCDTDGIPIDSNHHWNR